MYKIEEAKCPYCNCDLGSPPKRKAKCEACGKYYYVRTRPSDRKRVIVTKKEADKIERGWEEYYFLKNIFRYPSISKRCFNKAKNLSLSKGENKSDIEIAWESMNRRLELLIEKRSCEKAADLYSDMFMFQKQRLVNLPLPKNGDKVWNLCKKRIMFLMKKEKWAALQIVYNLMARILRAEGKDNFEMLQEAMKCWLRFLRKLGFRTVKILTLRDACKICRKLSGRKLTIEEALNKMPIPVKGCLTDLFKTGEMVCRCRYDEQYKNFKPC